MKIEKYFNDKKIVLTQGDITDSETDVIVNAANNHLWMGAGEAGAIKSKGGAEIEKEAIAKGPIQIGAAIVTSAGKLHAKYVIHAAVMGQDLQTNEKYVREATWNSLKKAEELKLSSISFPALGTGVGGFPILKCADAMINTVAGFFRDNNFIKEVCFVLFEKEDYDVFTLVLDEVKSMFQWSLEWIEVKQQGFFELSKKTFVSCEILLKESEELLVEAMNIARDFFHIKKDANFNHVFLILSSYMIQDAEAVKKTIPKGLFTSSSILLRHTYSCNMVLTFLRNFPEHINQWLEESKKDLSLTGKDMNPMFKEGNIEKRLTEKSESSGYELFNVLSKAMHAAPNWEYQFQDFNIFSFLHTESFSEYEALYEAFIGFLHLTVGQFLKKYQLEIKDNNDLKKLRFRYDDLLSKCKAYRNKLNEEINRQIN
jgi:O-acetyl-ADP-ribose deacetylase (regulator of RNase III)